MTISPVTRVLAGTSLHLPSRRTWECIARCFFSAWISLSALYSSQKPTTAFSASMKKIMTKSSQCRTTAESIAAISIIHAIGPHRNLRNRMIGLMCTSLMAFGPSFLSRAAASSWVSPSLILDLNLVTASSIVPVSVGTFTASLDASAFAPSALGASAFAASAWHRPWHSGFGCIGLGLAGVSRFREREDSAFCQSSSALPGSPWRA